MTPNGRDPRVMETDHENSPFADNRGQRGHPRRSIAADRTHDATPFLYSAFTWRASKLRTPVRPP